MFDWFTDAFTKPFAALTLLDLIKAFIAWCGSLFFLFALVGGIAGDWERRQKLRRAKKAESPQSSGQSDPPLDDQGRPYD